MFWTFIAYSYSLVLIGTLLVFNLYLNTPRTHRVQSTLVLAGTLIPWATVVLVLSPIPNMPTVGLNIIVLTVSALVFLKASLMSSVQNETSLALNIVIDHLDDGIMIMDPKGKIAYLNKKAQAVLEKGEEVVGERSEDMFPDLMGVIRSLDQNEGRAKGMPLVLELKGGEFEVRVSELKGVDGSTSGSLLTLRDITQEWNFRESQRLSNEKLKKLYEVTSSEILNELTIFKGYFELASPSWPEGSRSKGHLEKMSVALDQIQRGMVLTSDFQRIGIERPRWQNLRTLVSRASKDVPEGMLESHVNGAEVFADPMLERVFLNLFENTMVHGERARKIYISTEHNGTDLLIWVEDDGIGIPQGKKEAVFELDHGKNKGLGLFTSRHILSMTGCRIEELGQPGKNCRFEITIPQGMWREGKAS